MTFEGWSVFALFWLVFVTTPGPNAVNCLSNGMTHGFTRALWGVLAILTQASLFLLLSSVGIAALIATSPDLFFVLKMAGAGFLIWLGIRGWMNAGIALTPGPITGGGIYRKALLIATINAKSVAGYVAAFSQFVQTDIPISQQMVLIAPTALCITALAYTGYTALGAGLGRLALGAVLNVWFLRGMALCFIAYGVALGLSSPASVKG